MNLKTNTLFLFIISLVLSAKGQSDFKPGYVITKENDTLHGLIEESSYFTLRENCVFKEPETEVIKRFKPLDIKSFRFLEGKYFVSKQVHIENVFLELLIKGELNVYYEFSQSEEKFYIEKEGEQLVLLPNNDDVVLMSGDKTQVFKRNKHSGILKYYMSDASDNLKQKVDLIDNPERKALIKIAKDYHNEVCESYDCIVFENNSRMQYVYLEPIGGVRYYSIGEAYFEYGAFIGVTSERTRRMSLKLGMVYHNGGDEKDFYRIFNLPLMYEYSFGSGKLFCKAIVGGGISIIDYLVELPYKKEIKFYYQKRYSDSYNYGVSLILGAGLGYKISNNFELEFDITGYAANNEGLYSYDGNNTFSLVSHLGLKCYFNKK